MFGGNNGQDEFDYVSMFHTDKDHPHMHFVINRRGMDKGDWLKIAQRHPYFNYDVMREKMVQCAAAHGIVLEATSRASRGIEDRPLNDADFRRRQRGEPIGLAFDPSEEPDMLGDGSTPRAHRPHRNDEDGPHARASASGSANDQSGGQDGTVEPHVFDEPVMDEIVPAARRQRSNRTVPPRSMTLRSGDGRGETQDAGATGRHDNAQPPANPRKRPADVPARTMELRSDAAKRARTEAPEQQPTLAEQVNRATAIDRAPPAPSRKRRAEVLERTMELRSDTAKRARTDAGMELRSGRTTRQSGQDASQTRHDDRDGQTRNR